MLLFNEHLNSKSKEPDGELLGQKHLCVVAGWGLEVEKYVFTAGKKTHIFILTYLVLETEVQNSTLPK